MTRRHGKSRQSQKTGTGVDTEPISGGIVAAKGAMVANRERFPEKGMPGGIPEPVGDDSIGGFYDSKAIFPDTQAQFKVHIINKERVVKQPIAAQGFGAQKGTRLHYGSYFTNNHAPGAMSLLWNFP